MTRRRGTQKKSFFSHSSPRFPTSAAVGCVPSPLFCVHVRSRCVRKRLRTRVTAWDYVKSPPPFAPNKLRGDEKSSPAIFSRKKGVVKKERNFRVSIITFRDFFGTSIQGVALFFFECSLNCLLSCSEWTLQEMLPLLEEKKLKTSFFLSYFAFPHRRLRKKYTFSFPMHMVNR